MHRQVLGRNRTSGGHPVIPAALKVAMKIPGVRSLLPRLIALGLRRPRVETPEVAPISR
jgi:hypothetical protein